MSDKRVVRDFIDGRHYDAADGRSADLLDPSTGAVDQIRFFAGAARVLEGWSVTPPHFIEKSRQ